jgi:hypothetical protein
MRRGKQHKPHPNRSLVIHIKKSAIIDFEVSLFDMQAFYYSGPQYSLGTCCSALLGLSLAIASDLLALVTCHVALLYRLSALAALRCLFSFARTFCRRDEKNSDLASLAQHALFSVDCIHTVKSHNS